MLFDKVMETTKRLQMSFGEEIRWKFKTPKTTAILTFRSGTHQMIEAAARLGLLYPAIPRRLSCNSEFTSFWTDPHHCFILNEVLTWARDASSIAASFLRDGKLSQEEIRGIVDSQLPHANWNGRSVTYAPWKPEARGLLLAIRLFDEGGIELPSILRDIRDWFRDDGWDEYGKPMNGIKRSEDFS